MNKCEVCSKEYEPKRATSKYCGPKCRKLAFHAKAQVSVPPVSVPLYEVTQELVDSRERTMLNAIADALDQASLEHCHANPDMYASRADAKSLNWGKWLNKHELELSPYKGNRVAIPGDWDYTGCCHEVDGVWRVKAA